MESSADRHGLQNLSAREQDLSEPQNDTESSNSNPPKVAQRSPDRYEVPPEYDSAVFWRESSKLLAAHQDDEARIMDKNLDTVFIFAGLFSAVNSAIIAITLNLLSPGPSDETNALLRQMITSPGNQTLPATSFSAAADAVHINIFFSLSLSFSLMSGFGAVVGKQWVLFYSRVTPGSNDEKEARERSQKMKGAVQWHLRLVLEAVLPMLLQAALGLFLVGILDFFWSLNHMVALVNLVFIATGFIIFLFTIFAATLNSDCPFQTPYSKVIILVVDFLIYVALVLGSFRERLDCWINRSEYFTFRTLVDSHHGKHQEKVTADIIDFMSTHAEERNACLATLNQICTIRSRESVLHAGRNWRQISESASTAASRSILSRAGIDIDYQILRLRAVLHINLSGSGPYLLRGVELEGVHRILTAAQEKKIPQQGALDELADISTSLNDITSMNMISENPGKPPRPLCLAAEIENFLRSRLCRLWITLERFADRGVIPEPAVIGLLSWVLSNVKELKQCEERGKEDAGLRNGLWKAYTVSEDHQQLRYIRDAVVKYKVSKEAATGSKIDALYASLVRGTERMLLGMPQSRSIHSWDVLETYQALSEMLWSITPALSHKDLHDQHLRKENADFLALHKQLRATLSTCILNFPGITFSSSDGILLPGDLWNLLATLSANQQKFDCSVDSLSMILSFLRAESYTILDLPPSAMQALANCLTDKELFSPVVQFLASNSEEWYNTWNEEVHQLFIQKLPSVLLYRWNSLENVAAVLRILLKWPQWRKAVSSALSSLKGYGYFDGMTRLLTVWQMFQDNIISNDNTPNEATGNIDHDLGMYWVSTEFLTLVDTYIQYLSECKWKWKSVNTMLGSYIEFMWCSIPPEHADKAKALEKAYKQLEEKCESMPQTVRLWRRIRQNQADWQDAGSAV